MSPEVAKGEMYTLSPDWWSVGIIVYQLMNKVSPYEKSTVEGSLNSIIKDNWRFTEEAIN